MSQIDKINDTAFWLALSYCLTGRQLKKIYDYFPNGGSAWLATNDELTRLALTTEAVQKITDKRKTLNPQKLFENFNKSGIKMVFYTDENYPELLKQCYDAPVILFYRGTLPNENEQPLGVVGTRRYTNYGKAVTLRLTQELANAGLTIVSGLARGIDGLAHETTINAGGRTVAILGSGLADDDIYPHEHLKLAKRIIENGGLLLSEYPPGVGPEKFHFPERNRIIAGYSLGTLVIEAPEKSGALITAKISLEYNREVMAVPGDIFSLNSAGVNGLIKLGARVVTEVTDVLETLQIKRITRNEPKINLLLSEVETKIFSILSHKPKHIDEITTTIQLNSSEVSSTLTVLEIRGIVKDLGGKYYVRLS